MAKVNNESSSTITSINGFIQQQPPHQHQNCFKEFDSLSHFNNNHDHQEEFKEGLQRFENLINEFFSPNTGNERKRQIELMLNGFSTQPNSWQTSYIYFEMTTNEYTKMFCLTIIETFVNQRWSILSSNSRHSFRNQLWKYLLANHSNISAAIRNKFCKILVLIARHDWPCNYPDFMANILELLTPDPGQNILHSASLILLGLNLLGTTVEELSAKYSSYQYHHHYSGTIEMQQMLQSQLPNMLQALTLLLESIISKHVNYYSATPPPSPTSIHNQNSNSNSSSSSNRSNASSPLNILTHITKSNDTLGNVFQLSLKKGLLHSIPEMDQEFVHLTSQIFVCLSQIIDFMPVSYFQSINPTLLSALYVLATFGSINSSYNSSKLGLISMNCINEIISKVSTFDSEANEFVYNVFQNTFLLLQLILTSSSSLKSANDYGEIRFDEIDEDYLKKFIDFLKLFIKNHLGRFEKFISFPTRDFLQLLFEFTAKMCHSYDCYLMLLDTWSVYFDYLENYIDQYQQLLLQTTTTTTTANNKIIFHNQNSGQHSSVNDNLFDEKLESIKEPILSFQLFLISSIQFSFNNDYLRHLDDESIDDDNRTELDNYFYQSIEIIAKITDIFPEESINYFDSYFNEKIQNLYFSLEYLINNHNNNDHKSSPSMMNGNVIESSTTTADNNDNNNNNNSNQNHQFIDRNAHVEQIKLRIKDFIIALQLYSRYSNFFIDKQYFDQYFRYIGTKFDKLCEILQFIDVHRMDKDNNLLCEQQTSNHHDQIILNPLLNEFLLLKAQLIATFKAYIVWYQQMCCLTNNIDSKQYDSTIQITQTIDHATIVINTCCSIICDNSMYSTQTFINDESKIVKLSESKKKLYHSASLTLNTFSANVRPSFIFNLQSVQKLFDSNFQTNLLRLIPPSSSINNNCIKNKYETTIIPLVDTILISQSISNFLILPWFQLSNEQQNWEHRSLYLNMFIGKLLHLFNNIDLINDSSNRLMMNVCDEKKSKCPNVYCRSLYILKQVIKSHSNSPLKSKQMLLLSLNSSLEAFLQLLIQNQLLNSTIVGCQITKHILALFIVVFKVLITRAHMDFIERTIQTLLEIINRHNFIVPITTTTRDNSSSSSSPTTTTTNMVEIWHGLQVVIKFLKLLILVIEQQSMNGFIRKILPNIIDFAVIRIQVALINGKSPMTIYLQNSNGSQYDIYHKLLKVYYQFLYELLLNNCRYFFPQRFTNNVVPTTSTTIKSSNNSGSIDYHHQQHQQQQQRHFDTIMEIFGESFLQPENIQIFKQNVDALDSMNEKLKLFERLNFREKFWERFLYLFIQTLLNHQLALLNESLYHIIFRLIAVDEQQFYNIFMPKFISNLSCLNDQQRLELLSNFRIEPPTTTASPHSSNQTSIDFPTFTTKLNQFICNIRHYYKCNI